MRIDLLLGKLHRGRITATRLDYEGSLTADPDLYEQVGMRAYQQIHILDCENGERFVTYLIAGTRGSRELCVNGPAARLCQAGDRIIVLAYASFEVGEAAAHTPKVLILDCENRAVR